MRNVREIELQSSFSNLGSMYRSGLALCPQNVFTLFKMFLSLSHASIFYVIWS